MDFKTYLRAKELAEYQAIVMYDKLQLDSPQWDKYHRRQRQAKEFTHRLLSMARKLEKRAEKAEADSARLRESLWTVGHEASRLREALDEWREYKVDDEDLRDLQEQAKGRDGDYMDSLAASSAYIFALEHRLRELTGAKP